MDLGLKGKFAVVSGSTAGIGLAIATTLAREGARIVINGRTQKRVSAAAERIRMELRGAEVTEVAADLGTADGIKAFIEQVPNADILINNLGIFEIKPFLEISDSDWMRVFETNVMSGVRLTRQYLARNAAQELGAGYFYFQRIRPADSGRDGALWHDENRANRRGSGRCRIRGGNQRNREFNSGGSDGVRRRGRFCSIHGYAAGSFQGAS